MAGDCDNNHCGKFVIVRRQHDDNSCYISRWNIRHRRIHLYVSVHQVRTRFFLLNGNALPELSWQ